MTLDNAMDRYHDNPTAKSAMKLAMIAKDYLCDGMIEPDTAAKIAVELDRDGHKLAMLYLMS